MNRRILIAALTGLVLLGAAGVGFARLMIGARHEVLGRPYANTTMVATVESLIDRRVIRAEGGAATVDEDRLAGEGLRSRTRAQVKSVLPFIRRDGEGRLALDSRAVEVRYRAVPGGSERAAIWDRDGQVLARSVKDSKTRRSSREYPLGAAGFHVVGASHPAFGDRGIEAAYRDELAGGQGVTLTLSARVQRAAAEALGDRAGAAIVIAVPSGEILAMASAPSFDPGQRGAEAWLAAERDRQAKPFLNRAIGNRYPPGSLFKVIDLAAWLEAPNREPALTVNCTGKSDRYRIRDKHAHGTVALEGAFARSCNVFFAEVGVRLGPRLMEMAERFGFNEPLPVLPAGRKGFPEVTSEAFVTYRGDLPHWWEARDFRRNPKVVAQSAIGQNLVVATPLQMALVAAIVGADGRRLDPVLVRSVGHAPDRQEHGSLGVGMVKPETARAIARMMVGVMTEGTGRGLPRLYHVGQEVKVGGSVAAGATPIAVAGKTGTAEVGMSPGTQRPHAWFIGFAPAERPEVAVAVLIEHAGAGAEAAGPVAIRLLAAGLDALHRPAPTAIATAPESPTPATPTPKPPPTPAEHQWTRSTGSKS